MQRQIARAPTAADADEKGGRKASKAAAEAASPRSAATRQARQARQATEQAHLTQLLGDDAVCVLCKDGLNAPDESGDPRLAGLIARSCRQRLATPAVGPVAGGGARPLSPPPWACGLWVF